MALVAELKRRKVFQVGAAYLVVGWLLVQAASIALPAFHAPDWALRSFILLVALGFPLALVLAWALDLTPEGLKVDEFGVGTKRLFTLAAILAALAVGWFMRGGAGDPGTDYEAPLGPQSTAVLPFVNMSADQANEYFSDGLTETLLHKLVQVDGLKVAARTSSFAFKGKQEDVRSIGQQLGVATLVEGSVQRAGDTLRITVQLVRSSDGAHIWSRNYDRPMQDLFAIQDEIAGAVTEALVGALLPEARAAIAAGGTTVLEAYDLYTRGLAELAVQNFSGLKRAEDHMRAAVERDPEYSDAWLGLVHTWWIQARFGMHSYAEFGRRAAPVLDRIEHTRPEDGLLLAFRGLQARFNGDPTAARSYFQRALAQHPNDARLHALNAADLFYGDAPREQILVEREAALRLDPLNPDYHGSLSNTLLELRRYDEAAAAARRAIELSPFDPTPYSRLATIAQAKGDTAGSILSMMRANRADPLDHEISAQIAPKLADLDEYAAAESWTQEAERVKPGNAYVVYARVLLEYTRGEHAAVHREITALIGRHEEERRNNWLQAVSRACLSARRTGRTGELVSALVRAGVLPATLDQAGFRGNVRPELTLDHQIGHLAALGPCLWEPGAKGAARRRDLFDVITALKGEGWAAQKQWQELAATLKDDTGPLVERFFANDAPVGNAPRAIAFHRYTHEMAEFVGLTSDPRVVARFQESERALREQRAALPRMLAAEGLQLPPPDPASRVTSPKSQ